MAKILYITYDGILEPLGQSQVLRYLEKLAREHEIALVSFEKKRDWEDDRLRRAVAGRVSCAGIHWVPLRYHKRPAVLGTALDVLNAVVVGSFLVLTRRIAVIHARSYVASLAALVLKKMFRRKFLFDMRGFWADERVERAGCSKDSALYRVAKRCERQFFLNADTVVSLTRAGVEVIARFSYLAGRLPPFVVIPTCTDLETFRLRPRADEGSFVVGYVGSADTAYLFEPVLRCFKIVLARRERARLLVVTRTPHDYVRGLLREYAIPEHSVEVKGVPHDEVAGEMARMDAAVFFVKPGFSTCASVPTKMGELLGCGVPCLGNAGVGDIESVLEQESVGVVLREFTPRAEEAAVARLLELCADADIRNRCVEVARRLFSLQDGVDCYDRVYRALSRGAA